MMRLRAAFDPPAVVLLVALVVVSLAGWTVHVALGLLGVAFVLLVVAWLLTGVQT